MTYQLGREPRGDFTISSTCSYGAPSVITCGPILDDEYFPTTYWLTCPTRVKKVSRLESTGWISKLNVELASRDDWKTKLGQAIEEQIELRRELLDGDNEDILALLASGIGGTVNRANIKCLHAHLADYLITKINPIGEKTANLMGEIECDKECLK